MKELQVRSANGFLRYHDLPGHGQTIMFIHGLGCAGSFDYPQVAAPLSQQGYRCILVDLMGSGFSDKPLDFNYRVEDHVETLLELIEALGLEQFVLFGHSLGGAVALSLANRCQEKVVKLILSESNLDSGGGFFSRTIAAYDEKTFVQEGFNAFVAQSRKVGNTKWAASLAMTLPKAAYQLSKSAVEGCQPSWREILYQLNCPRTFIFGEKTLPDADEQDLAEQGILIEVVENAGHAMAVENPSGLAAGILKGLLYEGSV